MSDLAWTRPLLAELCGVTIVTSTFEQYDPSGWRDSQGKFYQGSWRPDEDIAQAVRCADRMRLLGWELCFSDIPDGWRASLTGGGKKGFGVGDARGPTLSHAIVLAIAAALGWENPEPAVDSGSSISGSARGR